MAAAGPGSRDGLADRVTACIDAKDIRGALAACQQLNRAHPDYAYGWYLASYLLKKSRRHADALTAIERALRLGPTDRYQLHKARCLFESGDRDAARAAVAAIGVAKVADARLHADVGSLLHELGDHPAALRHYERAVALDAGNAEYRFSLAAVQRYLGDASAAEAGFDAAIARNPQEYEAYHGRAQLRRQTRDHNHVAELREVLSRTTAVVGQIQLGFALAKELEDLGEFDEAFASLKQAADLKRGHMRYELATDLGIIERIQQVFAAPLFDGRNRGSEGRGAIFIVGLPRTGTTLVERVLDSHPEVHSAGELNNFAIELMRLVKGTPGPPPATRLDFVDRTATLDFRALGDAYLASTASLRDGRPHFIDKLPFNFLYAGLIHLALPKARIVNLQRHPMDTCYAVYKQLFRDAYPFSYDLEELGRYYIAYERLMRHWNGVLPGVIHTVRYEDIVSDLEGEARRLLDYCGLPWDERCLRFHESARASTTASALQVRQPVYGSSVGNWRHYERQLAPLRALLEGAGIATG